jgi:hypothetical protein
MCRLDVFRAGVRTVVRSLVTAAFDTTAAVPDLSAVLDFVELQCGSAGTDAAAGASAGAGGSERRTVSSAVVSTVLNALLEAATAALSSPSSSASSFAAAADSKRPGGGDGGGGGAVAMEVDAAARDSRSGAPAAATAPALDAALRLLLLPAR